MFQRAFICVLPTEGTKGTAHMATVPLLHNDELTIYHYSENLSVGTSLHHSSEVAEHRPHLLEADQNR